MARVHTDLVTVATHHTQTPGNIAAPAAPRSSTRRAPVRIERLILHGLDNRNNRLDIVDAPALLTDESAAFFATHIGAATDRADWHGRFSDPAGEVPALCRALLHRDDDFVGASQVLARRLYEQMRPRTVAPGDFVAAVYTTEDTSQRGIALLKLDPDQRLSRTFSFEGGRRRVSIAAANNLLPDTSRLQKCALVRPPSLHADFDVTILDTQAGPRADGVAAFFYRGFLTAELSPSPRRFTREFLRCTDRWLSDHRDALTPTDMDVYYVARRAALTRDEVDCAGFVAEALPAYPDLRDGLLAQLGAALAPDGYVDPRHPLHFTVDHGIAAPVTHRVTLELDGGTRLTVPLERYADLVRVEPTRTAEGKFRIVIESLTLKEVSER